MLPARLMPTRRRVLLLPLGARFSAESPQFRAAARVLEPSSGARSKSTPASAENTSPSRRNSIDKELAVKQKAFASSPSERLWHGPFVAPVTTGYTSSFGARRVYNGKTRSVHHGLDYLAAMGTPVKAANSGRAIAKSGSSGRVTGPHLHFALQWQGIHLEPSTRMRLWSDDRGTKLRGSAV